MAASKPTRANDTQPLLALWNKRQGWVPCHEQAIAALPLGRRRRVHGLAISRRAASRVDTAAGSAELARGPARSASQSPSSILSGRLRCPCEGSARRRSSTEMSRSGSCRAPLAHGTQALRRRLDQPMLHQPGSVCRRLQRANEALVASRVQPATSGVADQLESS